VALNKLPKRLYEFGLFLLDATEHVLLHQHEKLPLSPKVFDTLLIFVENEGHILEKTELMQSLWPDSFVDESSLSQSIFLLRKALAEKDPEHKYIDTIPKRGYRFTADVKRTLSTLNQINSHQESRDITETNLSLDRTADRPDHKSDVVIGSNSRRGLKPWVIAMAVILSLGVVLGVNEYDDRHRSAEASSKFSSMKISRLTTTGEAALAAISPDGKYVGYDLPESDTSQERDVFVLAVDGTREIPAVIHRGQDIMMGWSPDGARLLFASDRSGSMDLWSLPFADGTP